MTQITEDQEYQPSSYYHWLQEDCLAAPCHAAGCSFDNLLVFSGQEKPNVEIYNPTQLCAVHHPQALVKPSRSEVEESAMLSSVQVPATQPLVQAPVGIRHKDCDGYSCTSYYSLHHFQPEAPQQDVVGALY